MKRVAITLVVSLVTLFMCVGLTSSAPYDPWCDLDTDGDIDIYDIVEIAGRYGTSETPLNRSELFNQSAGWFPPPAYDSGWIEVPQNISNNVTLTHGLQTTEVFVYAIGKTNTSGIHQGNYGLNWYPYLASGGQMGIRWYDLNATHIKVGRGQIDHLSPSVAWNYTRIMIWKIFTP